MTPSSVAAVIDAVLGRAAHLGFAALALGEAPRADRDAFVRFFSKVERPLLIGES